MKTVNVDQVMSWKPCYDESTGAYGRDYVERLFAGRERLSALEILELNIPINDRFWAVLREDLIDAPTLRLWAADCAEHVLHLFEAERTDDKRPRRAIEAARAYARGWISFDDMDAARDAAGDAAWAAARDAAGAAAWDAEGDAARAAARAAEWDAAWDAEWAAAGAAAWAAAWAAAGAAEWDAAGAAEWAAEGAAAWAAAGAAAGDAEVEWQVSRLISYLNGEPNPKPEVAS